MTIIHKTATLLTIIIQLLNCCLAFNSGLIPSKRDYRFKLERIVCDFNLTEPSYWKQGSRCFLNAHNETAISFNMDLFVKTDRPKDEQIRVALYIKQGSRYMNVVEQRKSNVCDYMKTYEMFLDKVVENSNLGPCPWKKGNYYVRNVMFDPNDYPPIRRDTYWRGDMEFSEGNSVILRASLYAYIEPIYDDYD